MTATKLCSGCGVEKPTFAFSIRRSRATRRFRADGLQSRCKDCNRAYNKAYRDANRGRAATRGVHRKAVLAEWPHMRTQYGRDSAAILRLADAYNLHPDTITRYLRSAGALEAAS